MTDLGIVVPRGSSGEVLKALILAGLVISSRLSLAERLLLPVKHPSVVLTCTMGLPLPLRRQLLVTKRR
jgi:hypothetical protein